MSMPATQLSASQEIWADYRCNLPRHCIGVSRHLQTALMQALTEQLGHERLRLSFEPFISLVGSEGARPGELANQLGISKQACNQTINQIERAGYLSRQPDPLDGRARLLVLTPRGVQLRQQGIELVGRFEAEYRDMLGVASFERLLLLLRELYSGLALPALSRSSAAAPAPGELAGRLPRLADYMMQRLMVLTSTRGHPGLKMSFSQVLSLIGLEGGRIGQMARVQQVSKQAISVVAAELEQLGYIQRCSDPADARQQVLQLTPTGMQLLADSVQSVALLEQEFVGILGPQGLAELQKLMRRLYQNLHLEEEIFGSSGSGSGPEPDLELLAAQLIKQLGTDNAARLASMLRRANGDVK